MRPETVRFMAVLWLACVLVRPAAAQKRYGPGVSDTEIRIGQTVPYSGPASAFSAIGKAELAYLTMINEQGGINGRRVRLISLDDGYSPPKGWEQTRKLVEQEQVVAIASTVGTATNAAIQQYLNRNGIPHLFPVSGASRWADRQHFPWTVALLPSYQTEARIYGKYILARKPDARIAVLYQNDDLGRDFLTGLRQALGERADRMIVEVASYEVTDPTLASQIVTLHASGADILMLFTTQKFAAQAIRKAADINWKPLRFLNSASSSVSATLKPAGIDRSIGIIGARFSKDPGDPRWIGDKAMLDWLAWMERYLPGSDPSDNFYVTGYNVVQILVQVLKQCGDDLTRDNVMRQATNLDLGLPMLLPGIGVTTSSADFSAIKQMQLTIFNGSNWEAFGAVMRE